MFFVLFISFFFFICFFFLLTSSSLVSLFVLSCEVFLPLFPLISFLCCSSSFQFIFLPSYCVLLHLLCLFYFAFSSSFSSYRCPPLSPPLSKLTFSSTFSPHTVSSRLYIFLLLLNFNSLYFMTFPFFSSFPFLFVFKEEQNLSLNCSSIDKFNHVDQIAWLALECSQPNQCKQ